MRRELQQEESVFPNFAGFADLMSALCLLFIIIAGILLFQYKLQLVELNKTQLENIKLQAKNKNLLAEEKSLGNGAVPKRFIIPNELNGKVFFRKGEATIQSGFYNDLNILANEILAELGNGNFNFVEIEGHTDKQPITTYKFQDNWDLGAARAIAVVRYFVSRGIKPKQLSAVSHGEFKPTDNMETEDAYSKNRRIEITLLKK
ncbi:MAG: OmpA family protein [Bacteroidetes bacterium]|nr:OmpA family protein [Bacteroidota bacterium]MCX6300243.1 OmpA family protein [Bacteroidota bacterium]